jgi:peptidoglycan hydrolase-like protein with peptidoglycan-binding domain
MLSRLYPNIFTQTYINKAKKYVGRVCCDCSGLISWYTGKVLGSSQLYSQAYARIPISQWQKFAVGTVVWKSGHVGVYLGNGKVAEAKGINYGTVISNINSQAWKYGLTFSWINYDIKTPVASDKITYKGINPYPIPTCTIRKGSRGDGAKWVQWELVEAGFDLVIDGDFGTKSVEALRNFQLSAKLTIDGACGPATRKALIGNTTTVSTKKVEEPAKTVVTPTINNELKNPYSKPTRTLKNGSNGVTVGWIQWQLVHKYGYNLSIDCSFGPATEAVVKEFQKDNGLTIDGIVGPATRNALM